MKCTSCGEEIEEGMKFCGSCGTPVPQDKNCPACGATIPLKMKFCSECGAPQDGSKPKAAAAFAMGDKNVIAGDVTGKKEEMNISGNATIIKNEDQTKQVRKCHVCGRMVLITQGFECPECGEFTCENCYDSDSGLCKSCADKKTSGKADKYRSAVKEALADGRIDFADRRKLDTLQRELGMNRDEALAIEAEEKAGGVSAKSVTSGLSTVEQVELETIAEQFYNSTVVEDALVKRIEKLYSSHRTDEKVLALYLPVLAAAEGGASNALSIINSLSADVLAAYITAADIYLAQGELAQAESYVNRAKAIWQDDPLVLCREAYLSLALYKQYGRQNFLDKAESIAQTVSAVQTQDKMLKSHQLRLAMLMEQAKGNEVPSMDEDFCKKNGLYYRIVESVHKKKIDSVEALKRALAVAIDGDVFTVLPGTYTIDFAIDKSVVFEGSEGEKNTCFEFTNGLPVTASAVFKEIKFTGGDVFTSNNLEITGKAKPQFIGCIFSSCGLKIKDSAYPLIENCEINDAETGVYIQDNAGANCSGCLIQHSTYGIYIENNKAKLEQQSVFKNVQVSKSVLSCIIISGAYAAPLFEQCKAYDGVSTGFYIYNGGKGTYRGCEAYGNKCVGFEVKDGCACTFTDCKSGTSSFSKTTGGTGFEL